MNLANALRPFGFCVNTPASSGDLFEHKACFAPYSIHAVVLIYHVLCKACIYKFPLSEEIDEFAFASAFAFFIFLGAIAKMGIIMKGTDRYPIAV